MKHLHKIIPFLIAAAVTFYCLQPTSVLATQGAVYFKPSSKSYTQNDTFTVQVWVDVQQATAIYHSSHGSITYPSSRLQATNVSNASSGANFGATIDQAAGKINYNTMLWGLLDAGYQAHVFDITFKAKGTGTATLGIASGSIFFDGPTSVRKATYTINAPHCPSGQTGTPPNCHTPPPPPPPPSNPTPTPKPTPTPTPKPKPTPSKPRTTTPTPSQPKSPTDESTIIPPENSTPFGDDSSTTDDGSDNTDTSASTLSIGSVKTSALYDKADISWLTSQKSQTTFAYGTSKDSLNLSSDVKAGEQESYSTSLANLQPGLTYYYQINATTSEEYTTYTGQFQTKGYPVVLTVTQNSKPLLGAQITIEGDTNSYTTGEDGAVSLNIIDGDHNVTIKKDDYETKEKITVAAVSFKAGGTPDTQNITIATVGGGSQSGSGSGAVIVGVIGFIFLILAAAGAFIFIKRRSAASTAAAVEAPTFDDNFWATLPGASGVQEDVYGDPVYTQPVAGYDPAAQPTVNNDGTYAVPGGYDAYGQPITNDGAAYSYPTQTADQYYADQSLSPYPQETNYMTAPDNYGYTSQPENYSADYQYPTTDPSMYPTDETGYSTQYQQVAATATDQPTTGDTPTEQPL